WHTLHCAAALTALPSPLLAAARRASVIFFQLSALPLGGVFACREVKRSTSCFFSASVAVPSAALLTRPFLPAMAFFMTSLIEYFGFSWASLTLSRNARVSSAVAPTNRCFIRLTFTKR